MKNYKSEYLNPKQALSTKSQILNVSNLRFDNSNLFRVSILDIRILSELTELIQ